MAKATDMNVHPTAWLAPVANNQQSLYYQEKPFPANVTGEFAKFFDAPQMTSSVARPVVRRRHQRQSFTCPFSPEIGGEGGRRPDEGAGRFIVKRS